jgi:DNA polymerase III subunit gamma/tau
MGEALYRKYRPKTFEDVTGQQHVKLTLKHQLEHDQLSHAYLFSGPRGVGKTTIARLLASAVNGEEAGTGTSMYITEIDAASHTGVDSVREHVIEAVRVAPGAGKKKVFIIDEVHMLSTSAFNALLKTLEEPPAHALFILATTEIHKIPQTILSRCQRFDFHRIAMPEMTLRLQMMAKEEGMKMDDAVYAQICRLSEGCLRDAESLLGQVLALGETHVTMEHASLVLPVTNLNIVISLIEAIVLRKLHEAVVVLNTFVDQGGSVKQLIDEMIDFTRTMMLLALDGPYHDHYDPNTMEAMRSMLTRYSLQECMHLVDVLLVVRNRKGHELFPHLPLEISFVDLCGGASGELGVSSELREESSQDSDDHPPSAGGAIIPPLSSRPNIMSGDLSAGRQGPSPVSSDSTVVDTVREKVDIPVAEILPDPPPPDVTLPDEPFVPADLPTPQAMSDVPDAAPEPGAMSEKEVALVTLEEIKMKWGRCIEEVSKKNVSIPLAMSHAEPVALDGRLLTVAFTHGFHFDAMNKSKNKKLFEGALNEVLGGEFSLDLLDKQEIVEETVSSLVDAFGGAVV